MGPNQLCSFPAGNRFRAVTLAFTRFMAILAFCLISISGLGQVSSGRGVLINDSAGQFTPNSELHGRVTAGDQPLAEALVRLRDLQTGASVSSVLTTSTGSFTLNGVPQGDYLFTVSYGTQEYRSQVHITHPQPAVEVRFPSALAPSTSTMVSAQRLRITAKAQRDLQDAKEALSRRDVKKAEHKLGEALKIEPSFAGALALRAALRLGRGDTTEALSDAEAAIHSDPNEADAYVIMSATLNALARFPEAERTMQQGLRLNPDGWQGHFEMAKALLGQERLNPAMDQVNEAMKSAPPEFAEIHLVRGWIFLHMKDFAQSAAELEIFLQKEPGAQKAAQIRQVLGQLRSNLAQARK